MANKKKDKVLILTGAFGEGHLQAARAIEQAMKIRSPEADPVVIDFMEWVHPALYPVSHYVYMKGIKKFPNLYGYMYYKTYQFNTFSKTLNAFFSLGMKKTLRMLKMVRPTVIVSTYPFASSMISKLKEYGLTDIPLVTVITDHTHHSSWLHPYTDHYLVGSYKVRQQLIRLGIPGRKISYTGIPIKPSFLKPVNKNALCEKYHLDPDLPTVLVMGGGEGLFGNGLFTAEKLDAVPFRMQLLIVCGHNEKLRVRLMNDLEGTRHAVYVHGYIDYVRDLMAVSDVMITKPGGVTTAEALAMELPMILYKALPGQEEDNAAFLTQAGAAVEAADGHDLIRRLISLIQNKEQLEKMKRNTLNIQNREAAFRALSVIYQSKVSRLLNAPDPQMPFVAEGKYARMRKKALLMNPPH
ncbi:MGDG synthase family glycosyltransferase [Weizmannia acidilactici]|uniref:MGDG synthase family glycosyltransferase n=1 Tax=Weizmannia acidilactici TaxID=2607726 RepID=UPI00124C713F|nr:glycosyltransferase [Weizmannia acidilactici]GER73192.1 galactosyldiacylglycerol synthase [Weizmannia acidilactici]